MMYNNKVAVAIRANGQILKEFKDTVFIPFGSEYSILIKNLNTKRAVFHVFLDGEDVTPDGLMLNAAQEIDLERWIKNGNLSEGNKFKFIERTASVENHRGVKLEDGLIRVEYQFEIDYPKPSPYVPYYGLHHNPDNHYWNNPLLRSSFGSTADSTGSVPMGNTVSSMNATASRSMSKGVTGHAIQTSNAAVQNSIAASQASYTNDVGITVPGSKSDQKFRTVASFPMDPTKYSMILKLLGETPDNKPVIQPVTVKAKPKCTTCGKHNKATSKFCADCGTALEIFA